MKLQGKTALVTGGATGIGYGIAKALAAEGCRVAISGRREDALKTATAEWSGQPPMIYRACDVADRAAVNSLFDWATKQLGRIDILVNSAGTNIKNRSMADMRPATSINPPTISQRNPTFNVKRGVTFQSSWK